MAALTKKLMLFVTYPAVSTAWCRWEPDNMKAVSGERICENRGLFCEVSWGDRTIISQKDEKLQSHLSSKFDLNEQYGCLFRKDRGDYHRKLQFPGRIHSRVVESLPPSSDVAKSDGISMEGGPDMTCLRNQSIFGTLSILAVESVHVQPAKEPYFCTILERHARPKMWSLEGIRRVTEWLLRNSCDVVPSSLIHWNTTRCTFLESAQRRAWKYWLCKLVIRSTHGSF
jgi:hypothetical protein